MNDFIVFYVAISVFFNATTYAISENAGPLTPVLVLTNPSSTDVTIQVTDSEDTATSKDIIIKNI